MAYVRPATRHRRVQQMGPETMLRKIIVQEPAELGGIFGGSKHASHAVVHPNESSSPERLWWDELGHLLAFSFC